MPSRDINPLREVVVGALAGVGAAFLMNGFQALWAKAGLPGAESGGDESGGAPAKAADLVAEPVTGAPVPAEARQQAASAVHYATGAALGVAYAVLASSLRGATLGKGVPFGAAVYLALDEGLVPALRLGPPKEETPDKQRVYAVISHLVFGFSTYSLRKLLGGR